MPVPVLSRDFHGCVPCCRAAGPFTTVMEAGRFRPTPAANCAVHEMERAVKEPAILDGEA